MNTRTLALAASFTLLAAVGAGVIHGQTQPKTIAELSPARKIQIANGLLAKQGKMANYRSTSNTMVWTARIGKNSKGHLVLGPGIDVIDFSKEGILLPMTPAGTSYSTFPLDLRVTLPSAGNYIVDVFVEPANWNPAPVFFGHSTRLDSGANMETDYQSTFSNIEKHFIFVLQAISPNHRIKVGCNKAWTFHRIEISKLN